jgi:two-component system, LytTR family, response regulator
MNRNQESHDMIKCIIVDDERPARECIQNYLNEFCQDVEVVSQADSARTALVAILKYNPDLVFLDVEMPNGNGFDLLRQLNRINFNVIFVTSYEKYAVKAFRFSATDFLLKPVNINELVEAVDRVRQEMNRKIDITNIETLLQITQSGTDHHNVIVIPNNEGFKVLNLDDIITCEAEGYCTIFHLISKGKLVSSKNLGYYNDFLSGHGFQRVHNSFLINLHHVKEYSSEGVITLAEGVQAPLGNTYFLEFFEKRK